MKIGIVAIAILMAVTLVGASVLTHYGEIKTAANVRQSIVFNGKEDNSAVEHTLDIVGGCCECYKEVIKNRACIDGDVDFVTTYNPGLWGDEIITTVYQVPTFTTLALNNKDSNWDEINGDDIEGTLIFETVKTTFDYTFDAIGLAADTDYCLIYYADPWAGNHPGAYIGTFTSDGTGVISTTGSKDLGMNLPSEPDANIDDNHGGSPDYYNHPYGAKIWLVPASDYDTSTQKIVSWNPDSYLFETDLVTYSDCDIEVPCWLAPMLGEVVVNPLTIPAGESVQLVICYNFAINITPGAYTISTKAIPN